MNFELNYQPYASNRFPVVAGRGMVNSTSALASSAGLKMIEQGGNAIDAAIATAAVLTVVEPTSNGIGSDAFAIVWYHGKLYGINGSGYAPANISIEKVMKNGGMDGRMPRYGWTPVTVSGAPKTWASLSKKFGKLPFSKLLEPAVGYARGGFPVSPTVAGLWSEGYRTYARLRPGRPEFDEWFRTFAPGGSAPKAGDMVTLKNHGDTLEEIGNTCAKSFYNGDLARRIVEDCKKYGGYLERNDYEEYDVSWVEPIGVNYRGYDVMELPPNGQGIVALMALNILKEFEFKEKESVDTCHRQIEAIKLAFADGMHYVTDPAYMEVPVKSLIHPEYGRIRSRLIGDAAGLPAFGKPTGSGTVYFCTADGEGNMVSMIQSNYNGFGSGIVVEGTGISLQNRGSDFSLDKNHYNALAPRKKTYHTIIPGFLLKDGKAVGPFGVMGAYMQPQGHVQVISNLIDFHLNPQMALDAPRWQWLSDKKIAVEASFSPAIARKLAERGHEVSVLLSSTSFGRGQVIVRQANNTLIGGTESRADSNIACY